MEERHLTRLHPNSWGKIASPWFAYKQVDQNDAKECSVCWENCTSYLHCANSEEHIVCKDCSKQMIENTAFVNPDASIDIKWKCPICRHNNEIGCWQFLPSTEQVKAKEASAERILQQTPEQQAQQEAQRAQRLAQARDTALSQAREREQEEQARRRRVRQQVTRENEEQARRRQEGQSQIIEDRVSRIDENAPSKFRWVLSLNWKNSIVNHFKAWIMYTSSNYVENTHHRPPSGAELNILKQEYNYEERKKSNQAPWFNFLYKRTPP